MESNDSPEIPDRRETSDIPGLPAGRERERESFSCKLYDHFVLRGFVYSLQIVVFHQKRGQRRALLGSFEGHTIDEVCVSCIVIHSVNLLPLKTNVNMGTVITHAKTQNKADCRRSETRTK